MNNLDLSVALATAPSSAFEELRERPRFWFPLLLLVASTAAMSWWYYSIVDIEWFKDAMVSNDPNMQKLPEAERAAAMSMLTRTTLLWSSVAGAIVALPIVLLLWALYLRLAAKVTKLPQRFKHWFALSCWTTLPVLLSTVVGAIFLIMSDTPQVSPSVLQPLSLNELLLHRPIGSPGYSLFESLGIPLVLGSILMIIGVRVWSQRSWVFSGIFTLLPTVVIYGIWAFVAFR
ncbi:MAG TPA: YIP1 family protein [Povalibacter sp.]